MNIKQLDNINLYEIIFIIIFSLLWKRKDESCNYYNHEIMLKLYINFSGTVLYVINLYFFSYPIINIFM